MEDCLLLISLGKYKKLHFISDSYI